jgi:hypothetical protein
MIHVATEETEAVPKKSETTNEHEKPREKKERVRPPTKVYELMYIFSRSQKCGRVSTSSHSYTFYSV